MENLFHILVTVAIYQPFRRDHFARHIGSGKQDMEYMPPDRRSFDSSIRTRSLQFGRQSIQPSADAAGMEICTTIISEAGPSMGPAHIDLFANHNNHRLPRFVTWKHQKRSVGHGHLVIRLEENQANYMHAYCGICRIGHWWRLPGNISSDYVLLTRFTGENYRTIIERRVNCNDGVLPSGSS